MRGIGMLVALIVFVWCLVPVARAQQGSGQDAFYGRYPDPVDPANPHARELQHARRALDESIQSFWQVYYQSYWDYNAVVAAYYRYADAYWRYHAVLRSYWQAQARRPSFVGRVTSPVSATATVSAPVAHGLPVPGARITLSTYVPPGQGRPVQLMGERVTGPDGRFEFRDLAPDVYAYSVQKDGYGLASGVVEVRGGTVERTIVLGPSRTLAGVVLTPQLWGNPPADYLTSPERYPPHAVSGARVTVSSRSPGNQDPRAYQERTVITDAQGRFRVDDLVASQVELKVEAQDYAIVTESVTLIGPVTEKRILLAYNGMPIPMAPPASGANPVAVDGAGTVDQPFGSR